MADFDTPWKEALDLYFEPFVALFFPHLHADVDWSRGHESLDKELQQVAREAEGGRRVVDKLVRVWLRDGREEWVLIHVEVQAWPEPEGDFGLRMYVYHSRIFDRYRRQVVSLAVLADERPAWRPDRFGYNHWGCSLEFRFPTVKLLDLPEQELEQSPNVFANVVLAHLAAQRTAGEDEPRRAQKLRLVRRLYERGLAAEQVRQVFRLIDWLLALPPEIEDEVWREVEQIEREKQMPYVTSVERIGIEKGMRQGLEKGLDRAVELNLLAKFGEEGRALMSVVRQQSASTEQYESLLQLIPTATSLDEVRAALDRQP